MGIDVNGRIFEEETGVEEAWNDDNFDRSNSRSTTPPQKSRNAWRSIEEYRERKMLREQIGDIFDEDDARSEPK